MKRYAGNRDPRFVAIHRGGDLDLATHRLLVAWAADCAEHVLPLFTEVHPSDTRPSHAIAIAREWSSGNATVAQAREAAFEAHAAARESSNSAAIAVLEQQAMLWQPLTWRTMNLGLQPMRFGQR
jgi:hypothetical protein